VPGYLKYISFFLLAVFCRVLVPDSLILALHQHTHTVEKKIPAKPGQAQLDTKHIHCPVEHLFNNSAYELPATLVFLIYNIPNTYLKQHHSIWKFTFPNTICLRGPPPMPAIVA